MTFTETMTPRERTVRVGNSHALTETNRTLAALSQPVDRPPVANPTNVATVDLMDLVDAPFPDACRDPELAARLAATGYTELGFDAVAPYFSIIQESSALGCDMQWEDKDNWPTVRECTVQSGRTPGTSTFPPDFSSTRTTLRLPSQLRSSNRRLVTRSPSSARPWGHGRWHTTSLASRTSC